MAAVGGSNYPNGFMQGIQIRGMPVQILYPGEVFWVNNSTVLAKGAIAGSNTNNGTYRSPFSTMEYAMGRTLANRGDIIAVMPGHAETIDSATDWLLDTAGVAVIGLGSGTRRPTFTFSVAATANIPVSAANISLYNLLFVANFADVTSVFTVSGTALATDFTVDSCEFRDTTASLNFLTILTDNATAQNLQGLKFHNNKIRGLGTTAATTPIKLTSAAHNRVSVTDNNVTLAVLNNTSALIAAGANILLQLEIARNIIFRPNTDTATGGVLLTTSATTDTGMVYDNKMKTLDVAGMIIATTSTALGFTENYISGTADTSGIILPAADSDAA